MERKHATRLAGLAGRNVKGIMGKRGEMKIMENTKKRKDIEVIARAVILYKGKILLCKRIDGDYWFLPGGHVEFGESAETALAREIKEELGADLGDINFIGAGENIFTQDGAEHHEYNLVFSANLVSRGELKSIEDHLEFAFVDIPEPDSINILPLALAQAVINWPADKKLFWTSEGYA